MAENGNGLNVKQQRLIGAMLSSPSVTQAAAAAGVGERTAHRWLREPAFRGALKEAEREALQGFTRSLVGLGAPALQALADALEPDVDLRVRLRAAEILSGKLATYVELTALEERLAALEAQVGLEGR